MPTPFDFEHADPWGSHFIDVESLNASVTDALTERIRRVRREGVQGSVPPTWSLLVLGPAGTGKTHLFARLRRQLGPTASFVHIRPDIGVEATPRHILAHVLASLQRETTKLAARQLDVLVGSVLATVQGGGPARPLLHLDDYRRASPEVREAVLESILERFEQLAIDGSADYLELLLRTPAMGRVERQAALAWLSGREPSEQQLARLGRTSALDDTEVIPALRTLAVMSALGAPLVLVFDQLENLIDPGGASDRIVAHGTLVSELVDNVRGLTIAQMALDTEWLRAIRPVLGASQRSRVEAHMLAVALPTPAEREELLRRWVEALPEEERHGDFPSPFATDQVERWCQAADMTPRALMIACRRSLAGEEAASGLPARDPLLSQPDLSLDACLERLWEERLVSARAEHLGATAEGTSVAVERLASSLLATVSLQGVEAKVRLLRSTTALEIARDGRRGTVVILQQNHPRSVAAGLHHALAAPEGRLLVIRDRALPFRPSWRSCEKRRAELLARPGAMWLDVDHEAIARALATHDFLAAARSRDIDDIQGQPVDEEVARRWLAEAGGHADDPLVRAALDVVAESPMAVSEPVITMAAPSGEVPPARDRLPTLMLEGPPAPDSAPSSEVASTPGRPTLLMPFGSERSPTPVGTLAVLERLRIASIERLLREVRASRRDASRADVDAELQSAGERVRWLGSSLVAYREELR